MKKITLTLIVLLPLILSAQTAEQLRAKVDKGDSKAMIEMARWYECGRLGEADSSDAYALYQKASAAGNAEATAHLARYELNYSGLHHDSTRTFELATESSQHGSAYGTYRLALCHLLGVDTPKNIDQFHTLLERAAKAGEPQAISLLGRCYFYGSNGYEHDVPLGIKWVKKVKDQIGGIRKYDVLSDYYKLLGDTATAQQMLQKGIDLYDLTCTTVQILLRFYAGDESVALGMVQEALEHLPGNTNLLSLMGLIYENALNPDIRNLSRAIELYKASDSYNRLGYIYYAGTDTQPANNSEALRMWRKGAAKGDEDCYTMLMVWHNQQGNTDSVMLMANQAMELNGYRTPDWLMSYYIDKKDYARAAKYGVIAAERGDEADRVIAARLYLHLGDTATATRLLERAIYNLHFDACANLSELQMEQGHFKKAQKTLEKGISHGSKQCHLMMARINAYNGDYANAIYHYRQAASDVADYELGRLYYLGYCGDDVEMDKEGLRLLHRAHQAGNLNASKILLKHYSVGDKDSSISVVKKIYEQDAPWALGLMGDLWSAWGNADSAMHYYRLSGEAGYSDGFANLGMILQEQGKPTEAFDLYQRAATLTDYNNALALCMLGEAYLQGNGTEADTIQGINLLQRAVEAGSAQAATDLGRYYNEGLYGLQQDDDSAFHYYKIASESDVPEADYYIGQTLYNEGYYESAVSYLGSASRNGSIPAAITYCHALLAGNGLEEDPTMGVRMLKGIVDDDEDNTGRAHALLGACYLMGLGTAIDTTQAVQCFERGAEYGSAPCCGALMGICANHNDTTGFVRWVQAGSEAGSLQCMVTMGTMLLNGDLLPKDEGRAANLFQQAADAGSLQAMCQLAECYENGMGVTLNSRTAFNLRMQAAEAGYPAAMRLVAYCYDEGIYVQSDQAKAIEWLQHAAEAGDLQSCYLLGKCYADGTGVKKNKRLAKKWLSLAAEYGHEEAAEALRSF